MALPCSATDPTWMDGRSGAAADRPEWLNPGQIGSRDGYVRA